MSRFLFAWHPFVFGFSPFLACFLGVTTAWADPVYERGVESTAYIVCEDPLVPGARAIGSGVLISQVPPRVLTNYHVVTEETKAMVCFVHRDENGKVISNREFYQAKLQTLAIPGRVIHRDASRDLALIQLDLPLLTRPMVTLSLLSASHSQILYKIGNSRAQDGEMWGFMAGQTLDVQRMVWEYASGQLVDSQVVSVRMPALPGDSGGPLLNDRGELVGLVAASNRDASATHQGIDISEVRDFLAEVVPTANLTSVDQLPSTKPEWFGAPCPFDTKLFPNQRENLMGGASAFRWKPIQ